ncbi:MAG: GntR family transcriptional regulator [Elusimicrobia bacterium]|nr:GntR family transcriptional regulator [Elusimicrobiota bacterium]
MRRKPGTVHDGLKTLTVDLREKRPVYVQLMDGIRRLAYLSRLEAGTRLPTVRALAIRLDVNHNTVARAYRELEHEGVVHSRVGRGTVMARLGREHENKSLLTRITELEREMRHRCVQLGLTEKQFLTYVRGKYRKA